MNIHTLEQYVEQKNAWGKLFGKKELSLLNTEDCQRIADMIDADLSPENLTCDGELSRAEVDRRYKMLTRCARELRAVEPSVKMYEY